MSTSFYSQHCTGTIVLFVIVIILSYFCLMNITERFKKEDPKLGHLRSYVAQIRPDIVERIDILEDSKSYTINKKKIYMCLRDENGEYYHDNMLLFVILHELAHVLCDEIGHTAKFQQIFQQLLEEASNAGIYDPDIEPVHNYCEY
jgi:hypothetical protein